MKFAKIILFILCLSIQFLSAQIEKVEVDDLSDEKVEEILKSIKEQGYTMQQAEVLLKSKGMSQIQVDKFKKRVQELNIKKEEEATIKKTDSISRKENKIVFGLTGEKQEGDQLKKQKDSLYGYDFFKNPKITFTPNINVATPKNYQLGSGDVLQIDVWGATEASYQKEINKQGNILVEGVGQIKLSGLNFDQATTKIRSYLSRIYSGIRASGNSYNKVYVGVNLTEVRTVQVNIVGEVEIPGTYSLSSLSTVLNALYAAGGPTKEGNFRKISLVRLGNKIADFDFYRYLQLGSEKGNLQLQDQDVIIVAPYEHLVTVTGAVKRVGYYQMKSGESMTDLFNYCGGLKPNAYKKSITVERVRGVGRKLIEFDIKNSKNENVINGDLILVKEISDTFENKVSIDGAIKVAGNYEFVKGMTVKDLIKKASGVTKEAFLSRGLITRFKNETDKKAVAFSLKEGSDDVVLESNDEVFIYGTEELRGKQELTVNGAVNEPQTLAFIDGMTVEDLIALAGGLKVGADAGNIEVSRRKRDGSFEKLGEVFNLSSYNDLRLSNKKFILEPFDVVSVRYLKGYTEQKQVSIKGEVMAPGEYAVTSKNERISDLITRAGGLSPYAYVEGATLIRKKKGEIDKKQIEFLKELQKKDVLSNEKIEKKEFRIGINLQQILNKKKGDEDLILEEGDELIVPTIKQTVEVRGEVYSPSLVQYIPGKSLKYYVNGAGGFSHLAKRSRAYVVYSNGSVDATDRFLFIKRYPDIKPGATILVPKKEERKRMSAAEVIGITTGLATLGILVDRIVSKK